MKNIKDPRQGGGGKGSSLFQPKGGKVVQTGEGGAGVLAGKGRVEGAMCVCLAGAPENFLGKKKNPLQQEKHLTPRKQAGQVFGNWVLENSETEMLKRVSTSRRCNLSRPIKTPAGGGVKGQEASISEEWVRYTVEEDLLSRSWAFRGGQTPFKIDVKKHPLSGGGGISFIVPQGAHNGNPGRAFDHPKLGTQKKKVVFKRGEGLIGY